MVTVKKKKKEDPIPIEEPPAETFPPFPTLPVEPEPTLEASPIPKQPSDTIKVKVLVGTLGCPDGRSFEKGEVFEISKRAFNLFERKLLEGDIEILE